MIGCAIVGPNAGDLIAEAVLAIEMGCDAEDIGLTIHPHPTLSETFAMSAEAFAGTLTDLYIPKKKERRWPSARSGCAPRGLARRIQERLRCEVVRSSRLERTAGMQPRSKERSAPRVFFFGVGYAPAQRLIQRERRTRRANGGAHESVAALRGQASHAYRFDGLDAHPGSSGP